MILTLKTVMMTVSVHVMNAFGANDNIFKSIHVSLTMAGKKKKKRVYVDAHHVKGHWKRV